MNPASMFLYRPTRTPDGVGGFTAALGTGTEFWGGISVHGPETSIRYDWGLDMQPEDIIVAEGAQYRVLQLVGIPEAPDQRALLERVAKPVTP